MDIGGARPNGTRHLAQQGMLSLWCRSSCTHFPSFPAAAVTGSALFLFGCCAKIDRSFSGMGDALHRSPVVGRGQGLQTSQGQFFSTGFHRVGRSVCMPNNERSIGIMCLNCFSGSGLFPPDTGVGRSTSRFSVGWAAPQRHQERWGPPFTGAAQAGGLGLRSGVRGGHPSTCHLAGPRLPARCSGPRRALPRWSRPTRGRPPFGGLVGRPQLVHSPEIRSGGQGGD